MLVYANGDNNIAPNLWIDLIEMVRAKLTPDIGLYVYADYPAGEPIPGTTSVFPSGSELMHIIGNGDVETLSTKAEEDFDNPNTLSAAITSVFNAHRADRYGLILWDHGGGWRYGFGGDEQNGTRTGRSIAVEAVATARSAPASRPPICRGGRSSSSFRTTRACSAAPRWRRRSRTSRVSSSPTRSSTTRTAGTTRTPSPGWPPTRRRARPISPGRKCRSGTPTTAASTKTCCSSRTWRSTCRRSARFTTSMNTLVATAKTSASVPSVARVFDMALPDYYMESLDANSPPIPLKDLGLILSSLAQNPAAPVATAAAAARTSLNAMVLARAMGAARTSQAGLNIGAGIPIAFTSSMSALYRQLVPTWNGGTHWADLIDLVRGGADATGPAISSTGLANNSLPVSHRRHGPAFRRRQQLHLQRRQVARCIFLQTFRRDYIAPGAYSSTGRARRSRSTRRRRPSRDDVAVAGDRGRERYPDPDLQDDGLLKQAGRTLYTELLVDIATLRADTAIVTINGLPNVFPIAALSGRA